MVHGVAGGGTVSKVSALGGKWNLAFRLAGFNLRRGRPRARPEPFWDERLEAPTEETCLRVASLRTPAALASGFCARLAPGLPVQAIRRAVRSAALALDLPIKLLIPAGGGSFHMLGLGNTHNSDCYSHIRIAFHVRRMYIFSCICVFLLCCDTLGDSGELW